MSNKKILFDIKNNKYFSLQEAQGFLEFNKASPGIYLVIERERKFLVETNEVFLFQKDFYVFLDPEEKMSLFSTKIMGERIFLLLTESLLVFLENQIKNGILFCIIQIFFKNILKKWKILLLGLLFVIVLEQKQTLSLEDQSYSYKYQLKKNIYAVYKNVLRDAQKELITEPKQLPNQKMDNSLSYKVVETHKPKIFKKRVKKVKAIQHDPDIDLFLKLKKIKRE